MGKGNRSKALRSNSARKNQGNQASTWILSTVILLLVVAILGVGVASWISGTGMIERNRILVKSQTGKYDLSQSMATFITWQTIYQYSYYSWSSMKSEKIPNTTQTYADYYGDASTFALANAGALVQEDLRTSLDPYMDIYLEYVAVCDAAHKANVTIGEEEQKTIDSAITELKDLQVKLGYGTFDAFLNKVVANGIKEKDVRAALKMTGLHAKYKEQIEEGYIADVTLDKLLTFRNENPDKYYKTDYLTFAASDKALAEKLLTAKNGDEFKEIIINAHFDKNYAQTYFTYLAEKDYETVKGKTNGNEGNKLNEALDAIGADATKVYKTEEFTDEADKALKDWLFSSARKVDETTKIATSKGIYIVAFIAKSDTTATEVSARIKFYDYKADASAYEDDQAFKDSVLETLLAEKRCEMLENKLNFTNADIDQILKDNGALELKGITKDSKEVPEAVLFQTFDLANKAGSVNRGFDDGVYYVVYIRSLETTGEGDDKVTKADIAYCSFGTDKAPYSTGSEKSDDLLKLLQAEGADMKEIMKNNNAIEKVDITKDTSSDEVPSAVVKKVFATGTAAKNVYTTNANGVYYVIYVDAHHTDKASIFYVECKSDFFYLVTNSLISALDEEGAYPVSNKQTYFKKDAAADSLEAWISEGFEIVEGSTAKSARKLGDTKMIEGKDKDNNTVYNTYIILDRVMYLDTYTVVDGAHLLVSDDEDKDHKAKAAEFIQKLEEAKKNGTTGNDLTALLYTLSPNTKVQSAFSEGAISDEALKNWLFDTENRQANDIYCANGEKTSYIGIYLGSSASWEAAAKEDWVTAQVDNWIAGLTAGYTVNEKALDRIGTTTAVTTAATTAAA